MLLTENKSHAFTLSIDWEDFGQLLGRDRSGVLTPPLPVTIDRQTGVILDLLGETGQKATFFILGMLAEHRPDLVKKIAADGHEIALHGNRHIDMRKLSREQAYADVLESKKLVTDIIGNEVYGFRAPYFSVDDSNLFVLEVLAELGLTYDSSIFPMKMKRYGIGDFEKEDALYELPNGQSIVELPLTLGKLNGKDVPVAGGGYIRALPKFLLNRLFSKLNEEEQNVMLYMHPYEFDSKSIDCSTNYPQQEDFSKIKTFVINLRWNLFRKSIVGKLRYLLNQYEFVTCKQKAEYVKTTAQRTRILGCKK